MNIREMTAKDLDQVISVISLTDEDDAKAAKKYYKKLWKQDSSYREAHSKDFVCLNEKGKLIANGGVMKDTDEGKDVWWLSWWYVDPKYQSKGIGSKLMKKNLKWLKAQNARKLYVDTSPLKAYSKARKFYHKLGFIEEGRLKDFYDEGEDMIIMGKKLS